MFDKAMAKTIKCRMIIIQRKVGQIYWIKHIYLIQQY